MNNVFVSQKMLHVQDSLAATIGFITSPENLQRFNDLESCDFMVGNPQEMPLPGFVEALQRWSIPQDKDWFAYKMSEPKSQQIIAESLLKWRGIHYRPEDVLMTTGAFSALAAALNAVVSPGDEVIFLSPPWFFYEALILAAGGVPVRVKVDPRTFEPDLFAIEAALTNRTRAIIVNSPNNPTGKIYSAEVLTGLAKLLNDAQKRAGRPIYLISDEAYSRIVFDGRTFQSPTQFYPYSFLVYTYGKTLLTPGQRLGFLVLPPEMSNREQVRNALFAALVLLGHAFPNALLQHGLADLDKLSIDIPHLEVKRNRMVQGLRQAGYELHSPEGTFYLLVRSPIADDLAFIRLLHRHKIYCLPGTIVEMPGYFRISLTASDAMIERALPAFAAACKEAQSQIPELSHAIGKS
jgi:aspartate aminotransferase